MERIVCMIQARLGSKRIKNKSIRYLGDKPLVFYAIDKALEVFEPEDIYINSPDDVFRNIATEKGIQFYKRPFHLGADEATTNEFLYEFMQNIECTSVMIINTTAPFVEMSTIRNIYRRMKDYDVVHTIQELYAESMIDYEPINYGRFSKVRSQDLPPIQVYTWGVMCFNKHKFMYNYEKYGCGIFGSISDKILYYPVKGFSTVDIDYEEDFELAEAIVGISNHTQNPKYYGAD